MRKKFLSVLLAMCMVVSMALPALAATVTFDGNGGTYQGNATYTVSSDTEVSFALPRFERDGYTLAGFSAGKDSAEADYQAGGTYTLNADSTLYAVWTQSGGTIAGGTCGDNLTWTLENGVLTILGSGEMEDYNHDWAIKDTPWMQYREEITSVVVSEGVTYIGNEAFGSSYSRGVLSNLTSVDLPSTLTGIGDYAFANSALVSVTIPDTVKTIGAQAFCYTDLTSVTIPDSVETIGNGAFYGTDLTSVSIPASVTSIGYGAVTTFWLTSIDLDPGNPSYAVEDNVLYDKAKTEIICFPLGSTSADYRIPSTIAEVDLSTFWYTALESITIPAGVTLTSKVTPSDGVIDSDRVITLYFEGEVPDISDWYFEANDGLATITAKQATSSGNDNTGDGNIGDDNTGNNNTGNAGNTGGSTSGGSTSSGSASDTTTDAETTTETIENADGSVTETTTTTETAETKNDDGSVTVTETITAASVTTAADGSASTQTVETVTTTTTAEDGAQTVSVTTTTAIETADGSTSTTVDTDGVVVAEVTLSETAVSAGGAVVLPMPAVTVTDDSGTAATVTVNTGSAEDVTVSIPVESAAAGTVAVLVHADGTEEIIKTSIAAENGLTAALPDGATVKVVDNSKSFADVGKSEWYGNAVDFVSSRELFNGTAPETFAPEESMTRAMLAVVLYRLDNEPDQAFHGAFGDVADGEWYSEGVSWAAEKGIVTGYGGGVFGADDAITREQLAVMLWRYAGQPDSGHKLTAGDAGDVSDWAKTAMAWANEHGVINGKGNGVLDPGGEATRAEVAQMLMNFVNAMYQ